MKRADVVIVGAGFAGIYAAWALARAGAQVTLVDSNDAIGGVLRSRVWKDFWLDNGTHNLDMRTALGETFFLDVLKDNILIIKDMEYASMVDREWTYGFAFPDLSKFSSKLSSRGIAELIALSKVDKWTAATSYLQWYEQNYGEVLTRTFTPMIKKVTGSDPSEFAVEANKSLSFFNRPKLGSDVEMILLKKRSAFFDDRLGVSNRCGEPCFLGMNTNKIFSYPAAKGMQGFCDSAKKRLEELNVEILLQSQVTSIGRSSDAGLRVELNGKNQLSANKLLWTLPQGPLAKVLSLNMQSNQNYTPVATTIFAYEVNREEIVGPDYLHDYSSDRIAFRYNRAGVYGNQIKPDGTTVVMAEVPHIPQFPNSFCTDQMSETVWKNLVESGFMSANAVCLDSTCWGIPAAYVVPKNGWRELYDEIGIAIERFSENIHYISFANQGRLEFMRYFEQTLSQKITR